MPGFQSFTRLTPADMLRLNVAVKPTAKPNPLGLVAGDPAGWPNGRRLEDDVVTVALRAVAGLSIPLVDKSYTPDAAASAVTDGTSNTTSHRRPRSRTSDSPAAATRPDPARRRRHDRGRGAQRLRRPRRRPARHRGRGRCSRGPDARRSRRPRGRTAPGGRPHPQHGYAPHVAVVSRPVAGGLQPSLVFGDVRAGDYVLTVKGTDDVRVRMQVLGGAVTEVDWV